jgi:predicted transcriptional regulator
LGKHDLGTGRKNKIHPMLLEEPKILLFATGVPREVIGSVELEGVDENGRGNPSLR